MGSHARAVEWQVARQLLHEAALSQLSRPVKQLPLAQAIGTTLAADVVTPLPVPHYDSSAMDGYATAGAPPWQLIYPDYPKDPTENIHKLTVQLVPGQATPIFTGGLLPEGAESILRSEHSHLFTYQRTKYVEPLDVPPTPGADIRRTGEERDAGARLALQGTVLSARLAASCAVGGVDAVNVYSPATVALAFSGNEVITRGVPGAGEVRDAFSGFAEHLIRGFGANIDSSQRLADTPEAFESWMRTDTAQILLITGGSSTSGVDMVRSTLTRLKAPYIFESVNVRPGHPALAAVLPEGRLLLGLPGNPLAAYTALCAYLPALLDGVYKRPLAPLLSAPVAHDITASPKGGTHIVPALLSRGLITALPRSQSHMLGGFAAADVLAVISSRGVCAGEQVSYLRFHQ